MAKLLCICGKIGCGKTYYANRLKEQEHAVILSTDEVTYDLTNNQQGEGYDEFARRVNLYLRKKAVEIVNAGCTVILDWGFWTKENRKEIKRYGVSNYGDSQRRYLLCGSSSGCGIGTGRRQAGINHSKRRRQPPFPDGHLRGDHFADAQGKTAHACGA